MIESIKALSETEKQELLMLVQSPAYEILIKVCENKRISIRDRLENETNEKMLYRLQGMAEQAKFLLALKKQYLEHEKTESKKRSTKSSSYIGSTVVKG